MHADEHPFIYIPGDRLNGQSNKKTGPHVSGTRLIPSSEVRYLERRTYT